MKDEIVSLRDYKHAIREMLLEENNSEPWSIAKRAEGSLLSHCIEFHANRNLRYNKRTGKTYDVSGKIAEFVYDKDVPVYDSNEECAYWAFSGHICNSISRIQRGYSA